MQANIKGNTHCDEIAKRPVTSGLRQDPDKKKEKEWQNLRNIMVRGLDPRNPRKLFGRSSFLYARVSPAPRSADGRWERLLEKTNGSDRYQTKLLLKSWAEVKSPRTEVNRFSWTYRRKWKLSFSSFYS